METKDNINIDRFSRSILDENVGIELLYNSESLDSLEFCNDDDARQYNFLCSELDLQPLQILQELQGPITSFHDEQQRKWFMPDHYKTLDVDEYISKKLPKDTTVEAIKRISIE